jgi:hypothetical protein
METLADVFERMEEEKMDAFLEGLDEGIRRKQAKEAAKAAKVAAPDKDAEKGGQS